MNNSPFLIDIIDTTNEPNIINEIMDAQDKLDGRLTEIVRSKSQLYTGYGVRDKEGKFRDVVDIQSVVELLKDIISQGATKALGIEHAESYVGKQCYYIDRVTFKKLYDGRPLGVCIDETTDSEGNVFVWFEKPFMLTRFEEKHRVRLTPKP